MILLKSFRHLSFVFLTTCGSSLMSRPRAATSVATNAVILPCLNMSSALTRAAWLLLPWMAAA